MSSFNKKYFSVCILVSIFSVLQLHANDNNWRFGYIETNGLTLLNGFDDLNKVLLLNNLADFSSDYNNSSTYGIFCENDKWIFSYSRYSLDGSISRGNNYMSKIQSDGNLLKVGYNIFHKFKSDLFLNFGGGMVDVLGGIRSDNLAKIEDVNVLSYGNDNVEIEQQNAVYLMELMFLYPVFTNAFRCSDLYLGLNCSYQYSVGRDAYLNHSLIDLGKTNFSGVNFGITLKWAFNITSKPHL